LTHMVFRKALQRIGYQAIVESDKLSPWAGRVAEHRTLSLVVLWVQARFTQKEIHDCIVSTHNLLRSRFEGADTRNTLWQWQWRGYKKPPSEELKGVRNLKVRILLCSVDRIPPQRLAAALPSYAANRDLSAYGWNGQELVGVNTLENQILPLSMSVLVFDEIRSERSALEKAHTLSSL